MKQFFILIIGLLATTFAYSQIDNPGGTTSVCSGTFHDTGGSGGDYSDNENITTTLCSNAGNCISVNFTSFDIETNFDFLSIFDGPNAASPSLGTFTGGTSPGLVTSTTGCLTFVFTSDFSVNVAGWDATISCSACPATADYLQPTAFINNEKVGACLVTDCGPFSYADNGNLSGNYSNNVPGIYSPQNAIYRVFCPDLAGNCMQVTFNSFNTEANFDYLWVRNGPTEYSPNFTAAPMSTTVWPSPPGIAAYDNALHGDLSGSVPFSFQSTDASGCISFAFLSDGSVNGPGWDATVQCIPCAGGPNGTDNNDCVRLTPLCSGTAVPSNASGPGIVAEGCTGTACPAGGENHSNWFTFQAFTTGTVNVTMTPATITDDYDFAIYGPNVTCTTLGSPIRCTDSGVQGTTGLTGAAGDNTEDVNGDSFLQTMNVIAGETYILVVDEWSANAGSGYTLSFGGTASLDCTILPIELVDFGAEYVPNEDVVDLFWTTATERNNDYFLVERSTNGIDFAPLTSVDGVGNTEYETKYYTADNDPEIGVNYYRLKQYDIDGEWEYSDVISVNILADYYDVISVSPNPTTGSTQIVFNCYDKSQSILKVFDGAGNILEQKTIDCQPGSNHAELDLSSLSDGVYMITLNTNYKSYSHKIVKH